MDAPHPSGHFGNSRSVRLAKPLARLSLAIIFAAQILAELLNASEATNKTTESSRAAETLDINPAFRQSGLIILNSNMLASAHGSETNTPAQQWERLFELAKQQHVDKDYTQSAKNFASIVEGKTPDEMKRSALIEMAVIAQEQAQWAKAQQILAQYLKLYPQDSGVPEVLLRQGLLYRKMGAPSLAFSKFYGVMTSALTLKRGQVAYYQRLVLHAQTEIAETYYLQGKYEEAAEFFKRLLKLHPSELNKTQIDFKLLRCAAASTNHSQVVAQAKEFLSHYPAAGEEPEVRFLLANSLKQLGQNKEAVQQVLLLLKSQQSAEEKKPVVWIYWQQRAGNQIANQMYQEGDYIDALEIYSALAPLDPSPTWQLPVWYQMGLSYERLQQPEKASATYASISAREKELASEASPGLKAVLDMAKWRHEFLDWQTQAERSSLTNAQLKALSPLSASQ